ncbi:tumor necrosis factor receptor superfamily member 1B [Protopterus annectens]|uniref:tumor necrosis factor receptor superfamily member 1B n=1 Tax=Protopterus annectens TaxID=7888 RepID=UPI001CFB8F42|nr:tumor necrosis factor receptor superfamily member 1B [Protopterus annectens]
MNMKTMWNYVWFLLWLNAAFSSQNKVKKPYIPPEGTDCKYKEEYKHSRTQKCCSMCPPGHHQFEACTEDSDTVCHPCKNNTYTEIWNRANCYKCIQKCSADYGLEETQPCNATHKRKCACQKDFYCVNIHLEVCKMCSPYTSCAKGYGVIKQGTSNSDTECAPCKPGTFSDVESHTELCKVQTNCEALGLRVLRIGTDVSDTVCDGIASKPPLNPTSTFTLNTNSKIIEAATKADNNTLIPVIQWTSSPVLLTYVNGNDIPLVAGILGGAFVIIITAFILFIVYKQNKSNHCPVKPSEDIIVKNKSPEKWKHNSVAVNNEQEERLLLDSPQSSNNSLDENGTSHVQRNNSDLRTKKTCTDRPQKSLASDSFKDYDGVKFQCGGSRPNSDHNCNGGTQVNVTCIVNVCNSEHNSAYTAQPNHNGGTESHDQTRPSTSFVPDDDIPLSSEEQSQTPEDVHYPTEEEDKCLHKLHRQNGKECHISVQDTEMQIL